MKYTLDWLSDPTVFAVNRETAHSDHSYTTDEGNLRQSLNGLWKFSYSEKPSERPADFYRNDFDVSGFKI